MTPKLKIIDGEECGAHAEIVRRVDDLEEWRHDVERDTKEEGRRLSDQLSAIHDRITAVGTQVAGLVGAGKGKSEGNTTWIAVIGVVLVLVQIAATWAMKGG